MVSSTSEAHSLVRLPSLIPSLCSPLLSCSYYRFDLTVEEAIELGKRAIVHATHRDAYSGGINNGQSPRLLSPSLSVVSLSPQCIT
jgi:hypothetical protein